jgi:membrane-associated phospholipid phosphatase
VLGFSRIDWLFPPFLWQQITSAFGVLVLSWLVTCAGLALLIRLAKPRLRERTRRVDTALRASAHRLRFASREDEEEALRRERVPLTWFFRFWTNFASAPVLMIASFVVPLVAFRHSMATGRLNPDYVAGWMLPGLCYSGSMLLSFVLKRVFRRRRPPLKKGDFGYKLTKDPSFPSGHSLTSFCFWAMVPAAAHFTGAPAEIIAKLAAASAAIVVLTGFSRIYLRVHFPSDVAGGFLIGTIWTGVCLMLLPNALRIG